MALKPTEPATGTLSHKTGQGNVEPFFALKVGSCSIFCTCGPQIAHDTYEINFANNVQLVERPPANPCNSQLNRPDAAVTSQQGSPPPTPLRTSATSQQGSLPLTPQRINDHSHNSEVTASISPSAPSAEAKGPAAKPDFSGKWLLTRVEGDWEAFLVEVGFGFMKRSLMRAAGYGAGKLTEEIIQQGSCEGCHLTVISTSPMGTVENAYSVNGTEQNAKNPEGEALTIVPQWEGDRLVTQAFGVNPRKKQATVSRSLVDGNYCQVMESPNGVQVKRFYTRQ